MYNDIIEAIQKGLYNPQQKRGENEIFVVDTHSKGTFHMDISVAHHKKKTTTSCISFYTLSNSNAKKQIGHIRELRTAFGLLQCHL